MRKTLFYFLFCGAIFAGCQKDNNSNDNSNTTTATSHSCGAKDVHNPKLSYGTIKDIDGNTYKTIQIGSQTWMAENLKTTRYRNGVSIPNITDNAKWSNDKIGAYCSYNNNSANDCPYGKLYNSYAIENTNELCPTGWHVPSETEWMTLVNFLGGIFVAGSKMKSTSTEYWDSLNEDATNSSGFSGLPGGVRGNFGYGEEFKSLGIYGGYRSSTVKNGIDNSRYDWLISLDQEDGVAREFNSTRSSGYSVRCVRD
jgi:uncharacterized protein (TIGR02145 family)